MKALILHVGDKYTRAIKSIEKINPDFVYFTYNNEYENYINKIIDESNVSFEYKTCLIEDFQSINESYEKSKEIFKELYSEGYELHVGVSNGTKAMVVGLSLASVGYECEFSYVGSVNGGRENGEVKPGHEKVFDEFHPMKRLATIEINRAKNYFNNYLFDESISNLEQAKKYLDDTEIIEIYIKIVKLYQQWDKFENMIEYFNYKRNKDSEAQLGYYLENQIYNEIIYNEKIKQHFTNREPEFVNQIEKNISFLDNKISRDGLIEKGDIYYYLPDLLNNAKRRIDEKKYDDATARLYRASELIAQIRLYELGIIDEKILRNEKIFHIRKLNLLELKKLKAIEFVAKQPDFQNSEEKTFKLTLNNSYQLLSFLGDELAERFLEDNIVKDLLSTRNNSILAHGLNPSNKEKSIELYNKIKEYAGETYNDLEKNMDYSKFPEFVDINL